MRRELLAVGLVLVLAVALAAAPAVEASPAREHGDDSTTSVVAAPANVAGSGTTVEAPRGREALDNDARAELYGVLERSPGIHFARAASRADVETSTARYHVRVLERSGLVETEHTLGKKRLFPVTASDETRAIDAAVADPTTGAVLSAVRRSDRATVSAVAERLDRAPSTVSEHLTRLDDAGVLDRERDGDAVVARLCGAARERLA